MVAIFFLALSFAALTSMISTVELCVRNFVDHGYADLGYGLKLYFDWLGVQPGLLTVDIGWPISRARPRFWNEAPSVYLGFTQSFFAF